ncbi:hypothetical protein H4R35_002653 [Dimargaris xerosporica]|nr:hypothetical protein H4R35_002653 [Dimargaris xerosporica]
MSVHIRIPASHDDDGPLRRRIRHRGWLARLQIGPWLRRVFEHKAHVRQLFFIALGVSVVLNTYLILSRQYQLDTTRPSSHIPHAAPAVSAPGSHPVEAPETVEAEGHANTETLLVKPITPPPFEQLDQGRYADLTDLIIVACHAVYLGSPYDTRQIRQSEAWALESFQHSGEVEGFLAHLGAGLDAMRANSRALLLFSGGQTHFTAGMRSEAQSYWEIAQGQQWLGSSDFWRVSTEEHARDSFENLLFSLCRFHELTGHYPRNVTVVSYPFKQERFTRLHRAALKLPEAKFHYIGLPQEPTSDPVKTDGERANAVTLFETDPYGCAGRLYAKRQSRNPFLRSHPYRHSCPELRPLLDYCQDNLNAAIYPDPLPWESN